LPQAEVKDAIAELSARLIDKRQLYLRQLYDAIIKSLNDQIAELGRRANVNLAMGGAITTIWLSILGYFVYTVHLAPLETTASLIYIGKRLTLVVFIEVFAYFFLRLYRYSIFEIKYFQNEITNARFKIVALEVCHHDGSKSTFDKMCIELVKTERNFILKKGETTLSLRRDEIEQMTDATIAKIAEQFLSSRDSAARP
jgi:hypothetical protein